jgi:hypothetical protein
MRIDPFHLDDFTLERDLFGRVELRGKRMMGRQWNFCRDQHGGTRYNLESGVHWPDSFYSNTHKRPIGSLFRLQEIMIEQHIGVGNALMLQQLRIVVDPAI